MQAISLQALSSRTTPSGLAQRGKRSSRQPTRSVTVNAAKGNDSDRQDQKGPNQVVMQAVGAFAAVQLALGGPAFAQDALPASAESSSARAEVNKETSDAPSLTDIGKNFKQNVFGGGDAASGAKDAASSAAGKAKNAAPDLSALDLFPKSAESDSARDEVNKETSNAPGLSDLGGNLLRSLSGGGGPDVGQAKDAADSAANKAKNAAPDLSQGIFDRAQKSIGKISTEAGGATSSFPDALTNLGKDQSVLGKKASQKATVASSQASSSASGAADSAKKGAESAKQGASKAAGKAAGKAKNAAPDLSQLPDPNALLDKIQGKASGAADQAKGSAQSAAGQARGATGSASGQAQGALGQAKGSAQNAVGKAKNAAGDLSQLPDPGALLDKVQGKASGAADQAKGSAQKVAGQAQGASGSASGQAQGALGAAKGSAQGAAGKAKNAASDLSQLPDPSALLDKIQGKASEAAGTAQGSAQKSAGQAQGAAGSASGQAQDAIGAAQGSAQDAAGKAKNAAPDLSQLPDPGSLFNKVQGKASGAADAAKGSAQQAAGKAQGATGGASGKAQGALGSAKGSAQSAVGKAKNAAGDLSQLPDPGALLDKVTGKASGAADQAKGSAQRAAGQAQGATGSASGQAQGALGSAKGSAQSAVGKAKNAAPDLSTAELPSGTDLFRRLQGKENTWDPIARQAQRAGAQAQKATSDVASAGSKAGAKAKNAASTASGKAKNAAPDLSFNPLDLITGEPQNAAQDSQKAAAELQSTGSHDFSAGGGRVKPSTEEAKDVAQGYNEGSKDLPVPNVGGDVETKDIN